MIKQRPDHAIAGDTVRERIIIAMPREGYEAMLDTMVKWARFGNLFAYEEDADRLSLQQWRQRRVMAKRLGIRLGAARAPEI